jgi:hypothetical protein
MTSVGITVPHGIDEQRLELFVILSPPHKPSFIRCSLWLPTVKSQ